MIVHASTFNESMTRAVWLRGKKCIFVLFLSVRLCLLELEAFGWVHFSLNCFKVDGRTAHSCLHSVTPISWIEDEERGVVERVIPLG
jgi:hypothetical protein